MSARSALPAGTALFNQPSPTRVLPGDYCHCILPVFLESKVRVALDFSARICLIFLD